MKLYKKVVGLIAVGSSVALFGSLAVAAPPGTPTASDNMSFAGTVASECSVQTQSAFTTAGGVVGTNDVAYVVTSPAGGANGIQDAGVAEERVTQLEASDTIVFDCNTNTVDLTVTATTVSAPSFANADDIDLNTVSTAKGVNHLVDVVLNGGPTSAATDEPALTNGAVVVDPTATGNDVATDLDGDLSVEVTSTFTVANAAEELGAGDYNAQFTVSVTAP